MSVLVSVTATLLVSPGVEEGEAVIKEESLVSPGSASYLAIQSVRTRINEHLTDAIAKAPCPAKRNKMDEENLGASVAVNNKDEDDQFDEVDED